MVNLRVINDLNNRRTQGNIQTLKGKQIKTEVLDMMYKLFSSLVENFGFEKLAGGLGAVSRTWEKKLMLLGVANLNPFTRLLFILGQAEML